MRTTVRLDDQLLKAAKGVAAASGKTLTEVISDALRESIARRKQAPKRRRVTLPTFTGKGVLPGVDINDSAGLLDLMDEYDATHRRKRTG